ncbi:phage replisome organizer N-terminal domain-containing protein [Staphylococcus aureus]|uniref:phage replisome organizer N-terminal domain-containing protein n=1 Tax=Staphylococcus aureus TaxID=1280 RepID=UPI0025526BE0|nr:phage replisome organizer N-terminal domain-containing protein [Staphylococcus aureus]
MGEVSWIKLKVGMFDDSKIKYIEALPERDTIITIWVKLLTLSGKYNEQGYIMLSENLPYNEEMLANEFSRPINSIRLAIQTFETLGMIEKVNGVIKVTNWEKHQNIEGLEKIRAQNRLRKQKQRENNRKLLNGHVTSRDSHATEEDKELDKELERDKEKDIDKNLSSNNSATDVTHEQFEEWWKLYDRKKDKKISFTKFKSCLKKHSFEQIMQGTREYLKTITDKQYQKYPKTFLNNESYMNDYSEEIKEEVNNQYVDAFQRASQSSIENLPF